MDITQPQKGNPANCDNLESTVLGEICQTEHNEYRFHLHVKSKNTVLIQTKQWWLA